MAMDYIPIQASAVPCERVFSSSKETITSRRNRIKPELMEALQMLKYYLKKKRMDFTAGWMSKEEDLSLEEDNFDADAMARLGNAGDVAEALNIIDLILVDDADE
jgi:hypothetical protein